MYCYKFHKLMVDLFRWAIKKAFEQESDAGTTLTELQKDLENAWQTLIDEGYFGE